MGGAEGAPCRGGRSSGAGALCLVLPSEVPCRCKQAPRSFQGAHCIDTRIRSVLPLRCGVCLCRGSVSSILASATSLTFLSIFSIKMFHPGPRQGVCCHRRL